MIVYRLHFIRHALTAGNVDHRFIGSTDLPALPEGLDVIRDYKDEGVYPTVSQVYTSPLLRCRQTAETIYEDTPIEVVDGLRELDFGALENKTPDEARELPEFEEYLRAVQSGNPSLKIPGGESMEQMLQRVSDAINYMIEDMFERNVTSAAVITHGGVISSILATWGLPKESLLFWAVDNGCGYTTLLQTDIWDKNQVFEIYDKIAPPLGQELSDDAYLDYAESLLTEEDLYEK